VDGDSSAEGESGGHLTGLNTSGNLYFGILHSIVLIYSPGGKILGGGALTEDLQTGVSMSEHACSP